MYQFSRAIYRELAPHIVPPCPGAPAARNHAAVLRACEAVVTRLATDRHYFARPARTLFWDIRAYFPMSEQSHVHQVVSRYIDYAQQFVAAHLLEGRTARTALVTTAGFTDVIELGRQARARLYDLCASAPEPLVPGELRFGAPERMGPDGPLRALQPAAARALASEVSRAQPQAVAVSLLHSYADPAHEQLLGSVLAELLPDAHCSLSSDLVGTFREFERTATTVLD